MTHLQTARLPQAQGLIDASGRVKAEKASTASGRSSTKLSRTPSARCQGSAARRSELEVNASRTWSSVTARITVPGHRLAYPAPPIKWETRASLRPSWASADGDCERRPDGRRSTECAVFIAVQKNDQLIRMVTRSVVSRGPALRAAEACAGSHAPSLGLMDTRCCGGGSEGIRTPDLVSAIHALSQLSYGPT